MSAISFGITKIRYCVDEFINPRYRAIASTPAARFYFLVNQENKVIQNSKSYNV